MPHDKDQPVDLSLPNPYGDAALTTKHQKRYVGYFKNAEGPVLEIGCGRGAMLQVLKDFGVDSYGLDFSSIAVDQCKEQHLTAVQGDAIEHIRGLGNSSLGGIFCAHVIEHFTPQDAADLFHEMFRVVKPGGAIVLITPNARDLRTTERFWLDTTHVRLYPQKLLLAMLNHEGFRKIATMEDREPSRNFMETLMKFLVRTWFLGYMFRGDLVVIATR
jgi:ubiquinone/menaquinone biosynthesis C-methylase UbiE